MYQRTIATGLGTTERRVLDIVWRHGPIARAALADITGLTPASITRLIRSLGERALLDETVDRAGARGQPARPISIAARSARSIGLYFSHSSMDLGLFDLAGSALEIQSRDAASLTPEKINEILADFIADVQARDLCEPERLLGVGIALPGDFRASDTLQAHAYFPAFDAAGALAALGQNVGYPVFLENDAASAALGERLYGSGQGVDDFLFVHIGHGVGGALVQGGRLYRGVNGNAGMVGIQFPSDRPRPSGQDLFAHMQAAGVDISDFPDLDDLSPTACAPLKAWLRRAGAQLREQLSITARILDPSAIIVGGRLPLPLLNWLVGEIDSPDFCNEGVGLPKPRILTSSLGRKAGMLGAASLPVFRTLLDSNDAVGEIVPGIRA